MYSFLLIGQSNMAGRGFVEDALPVDTSRVFVTRNCRWWPFYRPVNPDRKTAGVNLAERFAERFCEKYDSEAGLICCADGGSRLDQWKKGEILFENAVFHAKMAQKSSQILGILWHQGESDCGDDLRFTYRERFETFVRDFREATGLWDVPFLVGGLGDFLSVCQVSPSLKNYATVNEALRSVAESDPRMAFVSAEGLGANPDNLHFCSAALYEFGSRYFDAFETLFDAAALAEDTHAVAVPSHIEHL